MPSGMIAASLLMLALPGAAQAQNGQAEQSPPGFTMSRTGGVNDFDYFEGAWETVQRRLKTRGGDDWEVFPATLCATPYLDGAATVDELYMPTLRRAGLTLRTFDPERRQWSIYWVSSVTGKLDPVPVVGGFAGNRGEFYAEDRVNGQPVKVRYLWVIEDQDHARWEQALSYDGRTWETNWTAEFIRADRARNCDAGRPRR